MKKIYYLLACIAVSISVMSCNPLDKTYKDLGDLPKPQSPAVTGAVTLSAADYNLLPKGYGAKTSLYFKEVDSAKVGVPLILAAKYPTYGEKSSFLVTYNLTPATIKVADSLYNNVFYAVQNPADYNASAAVTGTTFKDWSAAQVLLYLTFKYPTPVANQLAVLNYLYFESGVTASSGVNLTDSFIYMNGVWTKIYTITPTQYTAAGRGNFGNFTANDVPNLPVIFNTLLKNDLTIVSPKIGDVKYVSYKYFASPTNYQRVLALTFDGTNWTTKPVTTTLAFVKTNGIWVADNSVSYGLVKADYTFISAIPNVGSVASMANLASFGNFNIQNGTTGWTDAQINAGIATFLKSKFTGAVVDQKYNISYSAYNGANITVTKTFKYDGTTFVYVP